MSRIASRTRCYLWIPEVKYCMLDLGSLGKLSGGEKRRHVSQNEVVFSDLEFVKELLVFGLVFGDQLT